MKWLPERGAETVVHDDHNVRLLFHFDREQTEEAADECVAVLKHVVIIVFCDVLELRPPTAHTSKTVTHKC